MSGAEEHGELRELAAGLEREREELGSSLARRRESVAALERTLADLGRGLLPRRARWLLLLLLLASVGAVIGYVVGGGARDRRARTELFGGALRDSHSPHLLVTSEPSGATVRVGGKLAGATPLLLDASPGPAIEVVIERSGPVRRRFARWVTIARGGGAHVHADPDYW
jgi:hypothetical protein